MVPRSSVLGGVVFPQADGTLQALTVPWWEVVLALALLAAAAWFFRRAAGKIFGTAVLLYGRDPTLREVWRWAREA